MTSRIKVNYEFVSCTDIGIKYPVNQDSLGFDKATLCFVLADGVGGHQAGETASKFVVEKLLEGQSILSKQQYPVHTLEECLKLLLVDTNKQLIDLANSKGLETGTTVVSGIVLNEQLHYMHVGDSRLYLLRNNLLAQLTKDDTLKQQVLDTALSSGTTINAKVPSNIVTQALGLTAEIEVHYGRVSLKHGDVLLCSSDGLHDVITLDTLQQHMVGADNLQQSANTLVKLALENGSLDNISVILMKYSSPYLGSLIDKIKKFTSKRNSKHG